MELFNPRLELYIYIYIKVNKVIFRFHIMFIVHVRIKESSKSVGPWAVPEDI